MNPNRQEKPKPKFAGQGNRLGSETVPSATGNPISNSVGESSRGAATQPELVTRTMTLWRDGFTIDDGPLMRLDDPANKEHLASIANGF